jgi:hypothetical protein
VYHIAVLPLRLIIGSDQLLSVVLRDGKAVRRVRSEAILDVNHAGRWIRGIEILGSTDFNLARAVKPFNPRRPLSSQSGGVTYDEDANAAFVYLSIKPPSSSSFESASRYSHSITPEAEFGFDADGGLLWLRFSPRDANTSAADFVALIDAPVERVNERLS